MRLRHKRFDHLVCLEKSIDEADHVIELMLKSKSSKPSKSGDDNDADGIPMYGEYALENYDFIERNLAETFVKR